MFKTFYSAIIALIIATSSHAADDDFLLLYIPTLVSTFSCEPGEFASCKYPVACTKIGGFWENNQCLEMTESRMNTELMGGKWYLVTSFSGGDFYNYIQFNASQTQRVGSSSDFFINGFSHSTSDFDDASPNNTTVSFDSANDDWFILDYWGRDLGTISSIEIVRVNNNLFTGCEFYLNYPDLTYQDGVCNPVRMTRNRFAKRLASRAVLNQRPAAKTAGSPVRVPGSAFRPQSNNKAGER